MIQPYDAPSYFIIIGALLLPIIIGLLRGKRYLVYQNIVTLIMLFLTFGGKSWHQGISIIIYLIWQWALVYSYFNYRQKKNATNVFVGAVLLAIAPLAIVKIAPFTLGHLSILAFLGISYLTFKAVQMVMEIRDGLIKEFDPKMFLQFLLFFPTISAGPIDRYRRFEKDFKQPPVKEEYIALISKGIWMIMLGSLYKFIIAHYIGTFAVPYTEKLALDVGGFSISLLMYMYSYSLNLFFDFAGYSLFAVGVSYLMGIQTPINFNKPFSSPNLKEFWNRWHMSLSFWFRDYVFMRMVFTLMKKKIFKSRITVSNIGYMTLFLLMGIWHGLTWFYIAYGLFHGVAMCINDAWLRYKKKHKNLPSNWATKALAIFITFNTVCFSFLIFSGIFAKMLH
ncbi:D-alanyl-lipoteichoic acid biosynthesis protein DltB [Carnobacterium maltaromaticum]|uniref:Teichoic acid D-alanyltransferase n=1 Tax=Carnobacterium maltaromaticum TaxID=2751 RepID=A0AAW9K0J7_CARML|nr:D-alanyl-lipoteichoic acid biosynthesis protein DltB [Carnobacterium maltaromaticum]MDZ5758386.1 D-alanyl-lipoteichoic acid biosynthesis protein DltB [Carnobacterium maltaromaticum]